SVFSYPYIDSLSISRSRASQIAIVYWIHKFWEAWMMATLRAIDGQFACLQKTHDRTPEFIVTRHLIRLPTHERPEVLLPPAPRLRHEMERLRRAARPWLETFRLPSDHHHAPHKRPKAHWTEYRRTEF